MREIAYIDYLIQRAMCRLFSLLFILFLLSACQQKSAGKRSFCYWKTAFNINDQEDSILNALAIEHFYLRFFDVDWEENLQQPLPVATIRDWDIPADSKQEITPSIFITNEVVLKSSRGQLDTLAINLHKRVKQLQEKYSNSFVSGAVRRYRKKNNIHFSEDTPISVDSIKLLAAEHFDGKIKEILIDCDWTAGTKGNYFYLLRKLKPLFTEYELAATVRLWQYKHAQKAGIPPVDRALLMCYNLESPGDYSVENSIVSLEELAKYIDKKSYSINIDLALPLFSWAIHFRGGKSKGILAGVKYQNCLTDTLNFKQIKDNRFVILQDQIIDDKYVRMGDEIRIDRVSAAEMEKITAFLKQSIKLSYDSRLSFYSWDLDYINDYELEQINQYYHTFGL